jgi:hypothetical protein
MLLYFSLPALWTWLPNFNVALATFNNRTIKSYKYDWSQDVIEEPLVGLTVCTSQTPHN